MYIDPIKLIQQNKAISGNLPLHGLERLINLLASINLEFGNDTIKNCDKVLNYRIAAKETVFGCCLYGNLEVTIDISCNRCAEIFALPLVSEFAVYPSQNILVNLPSKQGLDVVECSAKGVDLYNLLEDELILLIPQFPKHERQELCISLKTDFLSPNIDDKIAKIAKSVRMSPVVEKPFNHLAELLK